MFKKILLAGTLMLGGTMLAPEPAQAQYYGPVIRYGVGRVYVPPVRPYRSYRYSPYYDGYRYGYNGYRYGYEPYFRGPAFGAPAYRGYYRSYQPSYGYPYYASPRGTGFSLQFGPVYRGW